MIERRLQRQLDRVAGRMRHRRIISAWSAVWMTVALLALLLLGLNWLWGWYVSQAVGGLTALGALAVLGVLLHSLRRPSDYHSIAQRVESSHPELQTTLLTAINQQPEGPTGRFGFMQHCVIEDSLRHAYRNAWVKVVPSSRLTMLHFGHLASIGCAAAALFSLSLWANPPRATERNRVVSDPPVIRAQGEFEVVVEPGHTEVERGDSLLVMARFRGDLPPDAQLVFTTASGNEGRLEMNKSLDDPVFGGRIADVTEDLYYRVEFAAQQTDEYRATVFEYPRLIRADAKLVFPSYTGEPERLVQDKRNLSAVEGTELTLLCRLNKPVSTAELVDRQDQRLKLSPSEDEPAVYRVTMTLKKTRRFELHLADAQGRANKQPAKFVINVLKNQPPDLKLVQPSRDIQVSPLEEVQLKANAWDDYGINRLGVAYAIGGQEPQEAVLGSNVAGKERVDVGHLVAMEELEAEPDQLLAYHFWVEDTDAEGHRRRVSSDMFFAEVRHFEEIFRQGRQPPGGAPPAGQQPMSGNAGAAQDLAELQKQIINATWKIIRRESGDELTDEFGDDILLVLESQTTALRQLDSLAREVQDSQSQVHVQDIRKHMLEAVALLARARNGPQREPLTPALAAEQLAYQAMLKLRAREHQVMRNRQSPSRSAGGGSSSRSQQQLQQLELNDDENRYETQRTAQPQEPQAERENRQILSRLRELARRQNDLNERLKELQSALQEAESEAEQEELRRQLKRLQEEQEQILRDTDELESRMDQPDNQETMAGERQQLEDTRRNVQQASEALEQGQVSRAVSSGTRAEREFEELRDEFRRRTSSQFSESMRNMRQQAQQLDETEQQLADELEELAQPQPRGGSLRDTGQREQLEEALRQQREQLEELLDNMRQTIEQSETAEPLLAEQLYDTARDAMQRNLDRSLESAAESVRRGFLDNAQEDEQEARAGISELRAGVDRAAGSVLGDEAEALRRARDELEQLARELKQEVQRNEPPEPPSGTEPDRENGRPAGRPDARDTAENERSERPDVAPTPAKASRQARPDSRQPGSPSPSEQARSASANGETEDPSDARQAAGESQPPQSTDRQTAAARRGRQTLSGNQNANPRGPETMELGPGNPRYEPLTGDDFRQWSDRLRDVEEMVEDPELRAEAARIRDRARGVRQDVRRHSQEPNWDLVELQIVRPLVELRDRVVEQLLRRASRDALVPIDRDPVPPRYSEQVRQYYERLGSGQ